MILGLLLAVAWFEAPREIERRTRAGKPYAEAFREVIGGLDEAAAALAVAAIDWITRQPWSDGRVGMFGGSYPGGAAWAATKRMPKALKTIVVGAPVGPAIDVPMENGIFWNFVYPWPFFTTDDKWLDNAI